MQYVIAQPLSSLVYSVATKYKVNVTDIMNETTNS